MSGPLSLVVEVAQAADFRDLVAQERIVASAAADSTCRVLIGGLRPDTIYWYRFVDSRGFSSRVGRTWTAPLPDDARPARFAFVCCQDVPLGYCTPYRHLIFEDEARAAEDQNRFILHLGDFIYDEVWYPEERPNGFLGRHIRDIVRFPDGAFADNTHVPVTVADYRALYRAYLEDPDLQAARARWPFVCIWDNHEFSSPAWQTVSDYAPNGAQSRKAAAAKAWFDYIPARVKKGPPNDSKTPLEEFEPPIVQDVPLTDFDDFGFSHEPNNVAALSCLTIYRSLRFGAHIKLVITDNRSYRSEPAAFAMEEDMGSPSAPFFTPAELIELYDAGRDLPGGPPATFSFNGKVYRNKRAASPPGSMLGKDQKVWFFSEIAEQSATWTFWGNSVGTLERRTDLHNLPPAMRRWWNGQSYGIAGSEDWGGYPRERAEILNFLRTNRIRNFVSLAGDRHQFFAGLLSPALPPREFEPVAVEFGVSSISTPTVFEAANYITRTVRPLRELYAQGADGSELPAINMTLKHGVRASVLLSESGDLARALAASNPDVAPHLAFTDSASHGYATVLATSDRLDAEFVAFSKPVVPTSRPDGDRPMYRVSFGVPSWRRTGTPKIDVERSEGVLPLGSL